MSTIKNQIQQVYIGLLGRAAEKDGLDYWTAEIEAGNIDIDGVRANIVNEQAEYAQGLGQMSRSQALNELYNNLFNRDADAEGLEYWVTGGGADVAFDQLVLALIDGAQSMDRLILDNRTEVGNYYSDFAGSFTEAEAAAVLAGVDNTRGSVESAKTMIDGGSYNSEIRLTTGEDILNGTRGDDLFTAKVVDNQNTFQSGDEIFGGAGEDTLEITLGDSSNFAILAKTQSVEIVDIRSQASNVWGNNGNNDLQNDSDLQNNIAGQLNLDQLGLSNIDGARNVVDAELMDGVEQWWNSNSRADLIIEDVRTNSHETTIGWRDADAGDVDYAVFFDNITAPGAGDGEATLVLELADVLDLAEAGNGLSELPYSGLTLTIDGENVELAIDFSALTGYADLAAQIQAELVANGYSNFTVEAGVDKTAVFSIDVTSNGVTYTQGSIGGLYNPIIITASDVAELNLFDYQRVEGAAAPSGNIVNTVLTDVTDPVPALTQTDIIFDNIGRGSMSGDFVAGAMSNGTNNNGGSGSAGIQQFNIDVDASSWIKTLASTNNSLEVVNVENIGANGDLRIADRSYDLDTGVNYGISDVRVFDASTMSGDVYLTAELTAAVTAKYLDLQDVQTNPSADNSDIQYRNVVDTEFSYDLGAGDDTLVLDISASNLAAAGTTNREDFELEINGGEGNDEIVLRVVEGNGALANATVGPFFANWYDNSELNANLTINAGNGDDVVRTPGSGNVVIDLGAGNDTVYVDNTGAYPDERKATFLFNVARDEDGATIAPWTDINNIQSDENNTGYRIYNGELVVTFKGFESVAVALPHTQGQVSDLQINQAIKNAINNDEVLSKLLEANDGPGNTLVVSSLIDGVIFENELSVNITAPQTLTAGEVTQLNNWYGLTGQQSAQLLQIMNDSIAAIEAKGDYNAEYATTWFSADYTGVASTHVSDNIITGGLGDDVIVLGTGAQSNDTVVYEGFGNGVDTIVNFDTTYTESELVVGNPGAKESFTVSFGDLTVPDQTQPVSIDFDGDTITLDNSVVTANLVPGADVAFEFANQFVGTNWTATYVPGTNQVTFENVANGNVADITAGDFVTTNATGTNTVSDYVQGVDDYTAAQDATATEFIVDFAGTIVNDSGTADFTFDTVNVDLTLGDGPITAAATVAAGAYPNWTAVDNLDGTVTFTSSTLGSGVAVPVAGDFNDSTAGVAASVTGTVGDDAVAQSGTATTTIVPAGAGLDFIDFTAYDVDAVEIVSTGQNVVFGTAPVVGDEWVRLTESTTNDGYYEVELVEQTATGQVVVGHIADLDFGVEQAFVEQNFFNSTLNTTLIA